jgi:tetratricopeptide (TPR) repeat protein
MRLQALPEERETYVLEAMGLLSCFVSKSYYLNMPYIGFTEVVFQVDAYLCYTEGFLPHSSRWESARVQDAAIVFAKMYQRADRRNKSLGLYRQVLDTREKVLGLDHISTLDTVHSLGNLYRDQGKQVEAEEMYRRALTGMLKELGPDHTSTLKTVNNLEYLYRDQGKLV